MLILHTGDPEDVLRNRFGGYAEQMARGARLEPCEAEIVAVHAGRL
ncbi:glutamine amidotransferase, partial [Achromobacter sp. DMS1]